MNTFDIISIWREQLNKENIQKIKSLIQNELNLFFSFEKEIYGADEDARLVFAKLKIPDGDYDISWDEAASFVGFNITRGLKEDNIPKKMFYKKDIKNIKIINLEEVEKLLK